MANSKNCTAPEYMVSINYPVITRDNKHKVRFSPDAIIFSPGSTIQLSCVKRFKYKLTPSHITSTRCKNDGNWDYQERPQCVQDNVSPAKKDLKVSNATVWTAQDKLITGVTSGIAGLVLIVFVVIFICSLMRRSRKKVTGCSTPSSDVLPGYSDDTGKPIFTLTQRPSHSYMHEDNDNINVSENIMHKHISKPSDKRRNKPRYLSKAQIPSRQAMEVPWNQSLDCVAFDDYTCSFGDHPIRRNTKTRNDRKSFAPPRQQTSNRRSRSTTNSEYSSTSSSEESDQTGWKRSTKRVHMSKWNDNIMGTQYGKNFDRAREYRLRRLYRHNSFSSSVADELGAPRYSFRDARMSPRKKSPTKQQRNIYDNYGHELKPDYTKHSKMELLPKAYRPDFLESYGRRGRGDDPWSNNRNHPTMIRDYYETTNGGHANLNRERQWRPADSHLWRFISDGRQDGRRPRLPYDDTSIL